MLAIIDNCVKELDKARDSMLPWGNGAAATIASIEYVRTVLDNTRTELNKQTDKTGAKELERVLNALALELPASVHQDAARRIRSLFEQQIIHSAERRWERPEAEEETQG